MRVKVLALSAALAGCEAGLPVLDPPHSGCQIRGVAVAPDFAFPTSGSVEAAGGAVTFIGDCPEALIVFQRTDEGVIYHGPPEMLEQLLATQPIAVTPAQLEELVRGASRP